MDLENIKEKECPICKSDIITEEKRSHKHCNRFWNEYRTFECGITLHFSPNFMKVEREGECRNDSKVKKREISIAILRSNIATLVENAKDIDNETKDKLHEKIDWYIK